MEKETIKNIIDFLEKNDNKNKPLKWKLLNKEPFTEDELNFKGDLNLQFSKITSLPKGLKVRHSLFLEYCTNLTSLPEGLEVGYNLYLYNSGIKLLPKGLKVYFDLFIGNTLLAKLSDDELREMIKPGYIKGEIRR
jgi:hypothetical protein